MKKLLKYFRKHWKPIIFTICLILFAVVVELLLKDKLKGFDAAVYNFIIQFKSDFLTKIMIIISFLCSFWFLLLISVIFMLACKKKRMVFYIVLNLLLCFLLNQTMKFTFLRNRPLDINLIIENGYSFPSGHSMLSLAFYGLFIYLIWHLKKTRFEKLILVVPLLILVLLIGISRIYLGVHYASDVLAGYALSMAYLIIFIRLFYKKMKS
jgi:undecaprenyl-diphosphatase